MPKLAETPCSPVAIISELLKRTEFNNLQFPEFTLRHGNPVELLG